MAAHNRRLKTILFTLNSVSYECQLSSWTVQNNTEDGEKMYSFCPDGEFREEADDDYALELTFYSDWRSAGISNFLVQNDQLNASFQLDHHPGVAGEHVRWTGTVKVKAPNVGGEVRTTEMTEVTLQIIGKPTYTRI